jgi:hypothetical protein
MKKFMSCALFLPVLFLVSCEMDIAATASIGDIAGLAGQTGKKYCVATISAPFSGDDFRQRTIGLIGAYFIAPENIRNSKDSSNLLLAEVRIPLSYRQADEKERSLFSVVVAQGESSYLVYLHLDKSLFDSLNEEAYGLERQKLDISQMGISFSLKNDTESPVRLNVASVYADAKPIPFSGVVAVERGQSVTIVPSDALRDTLQAEDSILIASIAK